MRNLKKSLSLILALALLVTSVFVGGITATAAELFTTTMTFDEDAELTDCDWDGQEGTNLSTRYGYDYVAVWSAHITQSPLTDATDRVAHFKMAKTITHDYPATVSLYQGGTNTLDRIKAKANTTYEIKFKYYVDVQSSKTIKLQVRLVSDMMYRCTNKDAIVCDEAVSINGTTDGWVWATAQFTTPETLLYPDFALVAATYDTSTISDVSIYVDDITLSECAPITAHNYDGEKDATVYASAFTTLAQLTVPQRDGYILTGIYSDAELTNKLNASDKALNYADIGVYYGWEKLSAGEYYAGFENYKTDINGVSYDTSTTSIVSGNTYAGGYNIKVDAAANSLNSFELRDKTAFETKAGTKYVISFQYRASADAKLYAGTALASDVPGTAKAIQGANLPASADWTGASIEVTLDKGQKEGYVPAFMVQALTDATVEFDHIYMTFPVEETQNIENKFVTSTDWYPVLGAPITDAPEEPEEEESQDSAVWNGQTEAPTANEEGIYIIDTAEKLAYIVKNGGKMYIRTDITYEDVIGDDGQPVLDEEGNPTKQEVKTDVYDTNCTFKLTKNIYLNDKASVNWLTGAKVSGATVRSWYTSGSFNGTIDGGYHTIYGFYSWNTGGTYASNNGARGFIPEVTNGDKVTIKNLTIDYASLKHTTNAGLFVGGNNTSYVTIDSCTVGANVYASAYRTAAFVGGSKTPKTTVVNNCASYATIEMGSLASGKDANSATIGLVSNYYIGTSVTVSNSFNANGPICSKSAAKLTVTNSFETVAGGETDGVTILKKEQMQGKNVLKEGGAMASLNATANYWTATDTYPILTASTGAEVIVKEIWDGTKVAPIDKDGDGIYEINSPKELAYVIYNGGTMMVDDVAVEGCSFILTRDIYLNDLSKYDWTSFTRLPWGQTTLKEWYDTSTDGAAFSGTIDGNNHSVYGLYSHYQWTDTYAGWDKGRGLIPSVANGKTATVKNLNIDCVFVHNEVCGAGVMVGVNYGTAIFENCSVGAKVYVNGSYAGAFVGANNDAEGVKLTNCYSLATLHGENDAGTTASLSGLTTNNWMSSGGQIVINNSYNANGRIAHEGGTMTGCYATEAGNVTNGVTILTAEQMQGKKALENMPNLNSLGAYTLTTALKYPALISFVPEDEIYVPEVEEEPEVELDETEVEYTYWDGTAVAPTVGDGTAENPWQVTTGSELYYIIKNNGNADVHYQLQNNIYLNDLSKINWKTGSVADGYTLRKWTSGSTFVGHLDGNGYNVYGLYFDDGKLGYGTSYSYATGLIPRIKDGGTATVKNIGVDYAFLRYDSNAGFIVGSLGKGANLTVERCYSGSNCYVDALYMGGIVGFIQHVETTLSITDCYTLASYNTAKNFGILGYSYWDSGATVTYKNCYNATGKLTAVSRSNQTAINCYEAIDGPVNNGVKVVANMKGQDVLTNQDKMSGLNGIYATKDANFKVANSDNYVYLPAGTIFGAEYKVLFFDTRMAPLDADDVMFVDRMVRGAYVKFLEEPDVTKIHVPVSKAHRVAYGTAQELLASGYYDLETEIIAENLAEQPENAVNYLFITDPHFGTGDDIHQVGPINQLALAIEMANEMDEIDFVCLGGDLTNGGYNTAAGWSKGVSSYLSVIKNCTKPVFVLVGNHDDNAYGTDPTSFKHDDDTKYSADEAYEAFKNKIVTNDVWQETIIDQFVNRTLEDGTVIEVVQDTDPYYNGEEAKVNSKYYYYDLEGKKTRVISLNASDFVYGYDENGNFEPVLKNSSKTLLREKYYCGYNFWGYSDHQMKWLAEEALGTLPDDYNVVFLSHMAITTNKANDESYYNGNVLSNIMAAYQNKTTYTHEGYGISADFSADTGRIMSYQHGHEHIVYEKYNPVPQVWQFSSSTPNPHSGGVGGRIKNENAGTIDVMSVGKGYVYKQALGQGDTALFINPYTIAEGDVTYDDVVDICDLVALRNNEVAGLPSAVMPVADYAKMCSLILGK